MTTTTRRRTYTREQWEAAQAAWAAGRFSDEWRPWRHMAATDAGIIDAPKGDRYDSWADEDPSERALLIRAIREMPEALARALRSGRVHSWAQVIRLVLQDRDALADKAYDRELDEGAGESGGPSREEAAASLRTILGRTRP